MHKKRFSLVPSRNIHTLCKKNAFFGVRAEILLSRNQGVLDSRAGPFLGYVQIYSFFEKYSPLLSHDDIKCENVFQSLGEIEEVGSG